MLLLGGTKGLGLRAGGRRGAPMRAAATGLKEPRVSGEGLEGLGGGPGRGLRGHSMAEIQKPTTNCTDRDIPVDGMDETMTPGADN